MISLIFKIAADAAGFNKTLKTEMPATAKESGKKAGKESGSEFGREFGSQVKGAVLAAVGIGAITAAIRDAVKTARDVADEASRTGLSPEATQELKKASELTGMSEQQLRETAVQAPKEFSALMESVRANSVTLNKGEVGQLTDVGSMATLGKEVLNKLVANLMSAVVASSGTTGSLKAASDLSAGIGGFTGNKTLVNVANSLAGYTDRAYGRLPLMPQDSTQSNTFSSPAGDLVRKLEELKQTMEKKL